MSGPSPPVIYMLEYTPWDIVKSYQGNNFGTKRMLHQGLKVKKLNNFSNFKSVLS